MLPPFRVEIKKMSKTELKTKKIKVLRKFWSEN